MSKTSRADWAASTPWNGITDKPANFGVSDIGGLTGNGYATGNVPVYDANSGRFRPGSRYPASAPVAPVTPGLTNEIYVQWDVPLLHALQCATEDFYFNGSFPSMPVCVGAPFSDQNVSISASVVDLNIVRIVVQNIGIADLDIGEGQWRLHLFNGL